MEEKYPLYKPIEECLEIVITTNVGNIGDIVNFYKNIDWTGIPFLGLEKFKKSVQKYDGRLIDEIEKRVENEILCVKR